MRRCSREHRVFFWEEAVFGHVDAPIIHVEPHENIFVVRPLLPHALSTTDFSEPLRLLLAQSLKLFKIDRPLAWYYAPMAIGFTEAPDAAAVVYDCMDELSAFRGAPQQMVEREQRLIKMADVMFAGGRSLFESKKRFHKNIHLFPSSIDFEHFAQARLPQPEPSDQAPIPHPRAGFYGVIDERFDFDLIAGAARLLPKVQFVLLGPIVKVAEHDLPRAANIHYLGQKSYAELPQYLSGWDVALIPFALNEATKYISPTKTPEYLAAARTVVSTPIADVIASYGSVVHIAATPDKFAAAITAAIKEGKQRNWTKRADASVAGQSWDATWAAMDKLVESALVGSRGPSSNLQSKEKLLRVEKRATCTTI
jgi:hypothetical protein